MFWAEGQTLSKVSEAGRRSPPPQPCGREQVGGDVAEGADSAGACRPHSANLSQGQWEIIERFTFIFEKDNPG